MINLKEALRGIRGRGHRLTSFEVRNFRGLPYEPVGDGLLLEGEYAEQGLAEFVENGNKIIRSPRVIALVFDEKYKFTLDLEKSNMVYGHDNGNDLELKAMVDYFELGGFKQEAGE